MNHRIPPEAARALLALMREEVSSVRTANALFSPTIGQQTREAWSRVIGRLGNLAGEDVDDLLPGNAFGRHPEVWGTLDHEREPGRNGEAPGGSS